MFFRRSCRAQQRTDPYGGNLENRMRLPMEVYQAVRQLWEETLLSASGSMVRISMLKETPLPKAAGLQGRFAELGS